MNTSIQEVNCWLKKQYFLKWWKFVPRLPVLVLSIAVVLICFYIQAKKKRASNDLTMPTTQVDNTSSMLYTISLGEEQAHVNILYDRFPPRYSDVDHPPPYSLVREPSLQCLHHCAQSWTFLHQESQNRLLQDIYVQFYIHSYFHTVWPQADKCLARRPIACQRAVSNNTTSGTSSLDGLCIRPHHPHPAPLTPHLMR